MNGWICLGLAAALTAALFGQSAIRAALRAGWAASLPTDTASPMGRAALSYFFRKWVQGPAFMAAAILFAAFAGAALTRGIV